MGLEVVLNQILERGREEEAKILREAEAEANRLIDQAEAKAREIQARRKGQAVQKVEALRRELLSASEFEIRRRLLVAQRELQEDFRKRVQAALTSLPAVRNRTILDRLHQQAKKELSSGVIHARGADLGLLAKDGYQKGRELGGAGGFQVESADQSIVLDYRYESLLENAWKQIVTENQALFEVA